MAGFAFVAIEVNAVGVKRADHSALRVEISPAWSSACCVRTVCMCFLEVVWGAGRGMVLIVESLGQLTRATG